MLKKNKNFMVSKKGCPFCERARCLLKEKNIEFADVDHTQNEALSEEISAKHKHTTYPKIFLNGKFVGGMSDLEEYSKTKEFRALTGQE